MIYNPTTKQKIKIPSKTPTQQSTPQSTPQSTQPIQHSADAVNEIKQMMRSILLQTTKPVKKPPKTRRIIIEKEVEPKQKPTNNQETHSDRQPQYMPIQYLPVMNPYTYNPQIDQRSNVQPIQNATVNTKPSTKREMVTSHMADKLIYWS